MNSADAEGNFLDLVYEAAIEPSRWADVLERFTGILGGSGATFLSQDETTYEGRALTFGEPAAMSLYLAHYIKCNPLLKTTDPDLPVFTDEQKLPKQELMRTEYYNDFLRRFDSHSLLCVRLALAHPSATSITVIRPVRREPFGSAEIAAAGRLHPHLVRANRLATRLNGMQQLQDSGAAYLERSSHGVFFIDATGFVRYLNRAGEALVADGCGLLLKGGVLHTTSPGATRKLSALIAKANERDPEVRSGGAMSMARPGRWPLSVVVVPVCGERRALFAASPCALVCVSDPETNIAAPEQLLCELFGLTPGEARVAALLFDGCDPREAAKRLGISFYTVRAHLVRIFDKTGTKRQADLVRLMMRTIGPLSA